MTKSDPQSHDDNSAMDARVMAERKPARRGRPRSESPKVEINIRLDAGTLVYLRGSGPGWQTRLNALLAKLIATGQI